MSNPDSRHDLSLENSALVPWTLLKAHYKRGALVWVAPELELDRVGKAMLSDDRVQVEGWISDRQITPFPISLADKEPTLRCFIAQPWVLGQEPIEAIRE